MYSQATETEMGEDEIGDSHDSPVDPGGLEEASIRKRRISDEKQYGNPISKKRMEQMELGNDTQEKVSGTLIIDFKGRSVEKKIVYDNDTVKFLLKNSPIGPKYSGKPLFNYNGHSMSLYINDARDIEELLKIDRLIHQEEEWPISCRRAEERPTMKYGVLKWINPNVDTVRIKDSLIRNGEKVTEVIRIENREGATHHVRLTFENQIPESVFYNEQYRKIHNYHPPQRTLICNNCSKSGHKADNCHSKPRCPQCGKGHNQRNCERMQEEVSRRDQSWRKCPNCEENHSAKFGGCPYFKKSAEIQKIKFKENISFHAARNVWKEKERDRIQIQPVTEEFEVQYPTLSGNTITPKNSPQLVNTESQTLLTVSDIDTELVPKDAETAKNVARVLLDFVDILTNFNEDIDVKKNKLINSVTNNLGIEVTNHGENQEKENSKATDMEDNELMDTCSLLMEQLAIINLAQTQYVPHIVKENLSHRVKKTMHYMLNKASPEQVKKFMDTREINMENLSSNSQNTGEIPNFSTKMDSDNQNGSKPPEIVKNMEEITWDQESFTEQDFILSATQQSAMDSFKKSFCNFTSTRRKN